MNSSDSEPNTEQVAVIGMAGRFPGARNIEEFWKNLRVGVESISFFSDEELISAGIDPQKFSHQNYVKAGAIMADPDYFDAQFFGFTNAEAETTDPQQRLLLECAYEALESAAYDPEQYKGQIGIFAGAATNRYRALVRAQQSRYEFLNPLQLRIGNDKDFLSTRVSYKLNLRGPSLNLNTACSTSLVATHLACQSLLHGECDIALAGGVSVLVPQVSGYLYQEGGIESPDGHCRPFDEQARGMVRGNGVGMVVLKRLSEAQSDGDVVWAIIKGSAINNDGAGKMGFTAPAIDGQAKVIAEALAVAEVSADSISYVEAHGTATQLGDPIEIAALTKAFRRGTKRNSFCAVGSVKSNVGHLDAAAGVTGLIKTVLALQQRELPPSLHFTRPNPQIDFDDSPFFVNAQLSTWTAGETPRRAGVSSFGIGGTNAHVVLEEAPAATTSSSDGRPWQTIVLSARTESALEQVSANLLSYLKEQPECNFADVAFTLALGRKALDYRRALVCRDRNDAIAVLAAKADTTIARRPSEPACFFMFPGQGAQRVNMLRGLYDDEPFFRLQIDLCCELLKPHLRLDLHDVLYPPAERLEEATVQLHRTALAQPALFTVEYALAKLLMKWGIKPIAFIGHSLGEYVAACLAGVFTLADGLEIAAARGRLMQQAPVGAMLAVPLSGNQLQSLLDSHPKVSLAADNCVTQTVVSGSPADIDALAIELKENGHECQKLISAHAFHSPAMGPVMAPFIEQMRKVKLHRPRVPFVSNLTGRWITTEQATDPVYWADHLRHTVRFAEGVGLLLDEANAMLLEVGPGQALSTFARQHPALAAEHLVCPSLGKTTDVFELLQTLGRLWQEGAQIDWSQFYAGQSRRRVKLPTYPFERRRYWVEPATVTDEPLIVDQPRVAQENDHENGAAIDPVTEQMIAQQLQLMSEQLELLEHWEH
jgi:acyl transferase domain-containing protein